MYKSAVVSHRGFSWIYVCIFSTVKSLMFIKVINMGSHDLVLNDPARMGEVN